MSKQKNDNKFNRRLTDGLEDYTAPALKPIEAAATTLSTPIRRLEKHQITNLDDLFSLSSKQRTIH